MQHVTSQYTRGNWKLVRCVKASEGRLAEEMGVGMQTIQLGG